MEATGSVEGAKDQHEVQFLGLSTCVWCRRTRQFLEKASVSFTFTYIDLLDGERKEATLDTLGRWNPRQSYPTIVIDGSRVIVGYKPEELREALNL